MFFLGFVGVCCCLIKDLQALQRACKVRVLEEILNKRWASHFWKSWKRVDVIQWIELVRKRWVFCPWWWHLKTILVAVIWRSIGFSNQCRKSGADLIYLTFSAGSSTRRGTQKRNVSSTRLWSTATQSSPSSPSSEPWGASRLTLAMPRELWVTQGDGCNGFG